MSDDAADILRAQLPAETKKLTVADAAAATGLSLADAERGLHVLCSEYRGHLRVGEEGDLVFLFPVGFTKPWETRDAIARAWDRVVGFVAGAARFVVRAWVAIVLVGYVAVFLALLIAMAFGGNRDSRSSDRGGGGLAFLLIRLVGEALFWTIHPFSPFRVDVDWTNRGSRRVAEKKTPFYERVDRFFFGPKKVPPPDAEAHRRVVLAEIRALKGRIGIGDVMRVTGLSRDEVDPLMSRMLVDYEGEIDVSDEGGIAYRFPDVRKTVQTAWAERPPPVWAEKKEARPLTGNSFGENFVIFALNAFNLLMSWWVYANGLTVERIFAIVRRVPRLYWPEPGTAIALGLVPLVFSIALFALPLGRALFRTFERKRAARENGRRAVLQAVLENAGKGGVTAKVLAEKYRIASGEEPSDAELTKEVRALGGDVDLEQAAAADGVHYRFVDLELEQKALDAEREAASDDEAKIGKVVFSSEV